MDLKDFKSGSYTQQKQYKSFTPSTVNHTWIWRNPKINTLLEDANHKLGALDAFSRQLPDVDYFIRMHVIKEATTSSRIEGTKTSVEEALLPGNEIGPERRDDWQEVQNYIAAMNTAVKRLQKVPVSTRLLKETHRTLLSKGRGSTQTPGEYRRTQNWIGGSSLRDAVFVPPSHIVQLGKRLPKAKTLVMNLYRNPRVTAAEVSALLRVTPKTANGLIQNLVDFDILIESTGNRRNRVFSFAEYVKLFAE